jgi:hypothetical protein
MIVLIFLSVAICRAQYRVLPGKLDADGLPTTSARICPGTTGADRGYTAPSDKYAFGLEPKAQTVAKLNGQDLILFTATFSGGGSGELTNLALLEERSGEFVNLLPVVQLTNQSEFNLWSLPQFSGLPILATADFVWDFKSQETHFAPHRYAVNVYAFDPKTARYLQRVHYVTTTKYPGLDDADSVRVLDAEKQAILAKLQPGPS